MRLQLEIAEGRFLTHRTDEQTHTSVFCLAATLPDHDERSPFDPDLLIIRVLVSWWYECVSVCYITIRVIHADVAAPSETRSMMTRCKSLFFFIFDKRQMTRGPCACYLLDVLLGHQIDEGMSCQYGINDGC